MDHLAHARYRELLERHIDGDLGTGERDVLFEHLENCDECREMLEAEERLIDNLSRIPKLVPPSDLRAQILQTLERERNEMNQNLAEDERFAAIFCAPEDERAEDELPFFASAGGTKPRRRARRSAWNRYSPAAATLFLFAASTGAFLTADLSRIAPLAQVQLAARDAIAQAASYARHSPEAEKPPQDDSANRIVIAEQGLDNPGDLTIAPGNPTASIDIKPLLPGPAERSEPLLGAIVLKPSDRGPDDVLGSDDLYDTIRENIVVVSDSAPMFDQFVFDGNLYRCCTVDVSEDWITELAGALEGYRAPAEEAELAVLTDQFPARAEEVGFFSAPRSVFQNSMLSSSAKAQGPQPGKSRPLKIIIVE